MGKHRSVGKSTFPATILRGDEFWQILQDFHTTYACMRWMSPILRAGPSAALGIVVDTTAPAPVITATGDDTGMPGDGVTSDNTLMVFGTAEAEATVELFLNDQSLGTAAADAGGAWSVQTGVIADGAYDLTAVATDLAGNVSAFSEPFGVTVDTAGAEQHPFVCALVQLC